MSSHDGVEQSTHTLVAPSYDAELVDDGLALAVLGGCSRKWQVAEWRKNMKRRAWAASASGRWLTFAKLVRQHKLQFTPT